MAYTNLLSVAQLNDLMKSGEPLVLLDCSHDLTDPQAGPRAYASGHLPGAHFLSMEKDLGGVKTGLNGRNPLPSREDFVQRMRTLGADDNTQIVVYDRTQATYATRAWWTLRWLGHTQVAVLDGGLQAWQAAGHPLEQALAALPAEGGFTDRGGSMPVVSFEDVLESLGKDTHLVIDARAEDRFRGENETLDPMGGHIPGAISRFYRHNLTPEGTFKSADVLRAEFVKMVGSRTGPELVMQCGSGVSACHNLLALEIAGLGTSPLYVGSWSEWCSRPNAPIATGPA